MTSVCDQDGCGPVLLHSSDRARTFEVRSEDERLQHVSFASSEHGWGRLETGDIVDGSLDQRLGTSDDGGRTWRLLETRCDGPDARVDGFWPVDDRLGWIACSAGGLRSRVDGLYRTRDGGETWELASPVDVLATGPDGFYDAMAFRTPRRGS